MMKDIIDRLAETKLPEDRIIRPNYTKKEDDILKTQETQVINTEEVNGIINKEKDIHNETDTNIITDLENKIDKLSNYVKSENEVITKAIKINRKNLHESKSSIKILYTGFFVYIILVMVIFASSLFYTAAENKRLTKRLNMLEDYYGYLSKVVNSEEEEDIANNSSTTASTIEEKKEVNNATNIASTKEEEKIAESDTEISTEVDEEEKEIDEVLTVINTEDKGEFTFDGFFNSVELTTNPNGTKNYKLTISVVDDPSHVYTLEAKNINTNAKSKESRQYEIISDISDALINTNYACSITLNKTKFTESNSNGETSTRDMYYINNYKGLGKR